MCDVIFLSTSDIAHILYIYFFLDGGKEHFSNPLVVSFFRSSLFSMHTLILTYDVHFLECLNTTGALCVHWIRVYICVDWVQMEDAQLHELQVRLHSSRTLEEMLLHATHLRHRINYLIYHQREEGTTALVGQDHPMFHPPNFNFNLKPSDNDLFKTHFC